MKDDNAASETKSQATDETSDINDIIEKANIPEGILEKLDRILLYIYKHSKRFGDYVTLDRYKDYPIACCKDSEEFLSFILALEKEYKKIYISEDTKPSILTGSNPISVSLSLEGYKKVEEIKKTTKKPDKCFVAMAINKDKELENLYNNYIASALVEEGYKPPFRADEHVKTEQITDRIIADIKQCSLFIAEVTPILYEVNDEKKYIHNENVYYEAGFARGFGIPIVYLCKEDLIDKLPFDTKPIRHLTWNSDLDKFKYEFKSWIEANIKI